MTDEQIKQNAEFMYKHASNADDKIDAYITGAHSRDEEIESLQKQIVHLSQREQMLFDREVELIAENDQLRNPWISVDDQLPPEFKPVIVIFDNGIIINAFMTIVKDEPAWHPSVEIPIGSDVLFWMHTPELKKGE